MLIKNNKKSSTLAPFFPPIYSLSILYRFPHTINNILYLIRAYDYKSTPRLTVRAVETTSK